MALIDIGLHAAVEAVGSNVPPATPAPGQCWVVGSAPAGAWAGEAGAVAGWTDGGWRFLPARDGMQVWNRATDRHATRVDGAWEEGVVRAGRLLVDGVPVVGARRPAVPAATGGTVIDAQARAAIAQILATLAAHGLIEA